jgi:3-oxoacyl-[acyl-carrier-protein] synthase-3
MSSAVTWQMPPASPHATVLGLGIHRAERVVPNSEIVGPIDSSDEWIQQRSGIKERRWVGPEETLESMSLAAARRALVATKIEPAQIDAVILATCTNTQQITSLASRIAYLLGTQSPAAFDISAACAGSVTPSPWPATWSAAGPPSTSS